MSGVRAQQKQKTRQALIVAAFNQLSAEHSFSNLKSSFLANYIFLKKIIVSKEILVLAAPVCFDEPDCFLIHVLTTKGGAFTKQAVLGPQLQLLLSFATFL